MNKALKWSLGILGGLLIVLVAVLLALGAAPVPLDSPPKPVEGGLIGAPSSAPTEPPVESDRTITVKAGESIQAAIDQARPGDVVAVEPGTYHEALKVSTHNLTLSGVPDPAGRYPLLDGQNQMDNGAFVSGSFFTIEKFEIRNYTQNGVIVQGAYSPIFRDLVIDNPGEYAVFPILSTRVLIERVTASGASDSALYVGESKDIVVRDSEAFQSVTGIEIENSVDALVENNYVHDNTAGILVFLLPHKTAKEGHSTRVSGNRVENNNLPNFADHGIVQEVPPGIGILILIADRTEVTGNTISGNNTVGVVMVSAETFFDDTSDFDIPRVPEGTRVHGNTYRNNGANPDPAAAQAGFPGGNDILWDAGSWDTTIDEPGARTFPYAPGSAWPEPLKRAVWQVVQLLK